jgi:hypothetical protein
MPRWLLAAVALSLLVLALIVARAIFVLPTNPRLTLANFDRMMEEIKPMTLEAIEAACGPPGDYRTGPTDRDNMEDAIRRHYEEKQLCWINDEVYIFAKTRADGVVLFGAGPVHPKTAGMVDWLKWRWQRWCNGSGL